MKHIVAPYEYPVYCITYMLTHNPEDVYETHALVRYEAISMLEDFNLNPSVSQCQISRLAPGLDY